MAATRYETLAEVSERLAVSDQDAPRWYQRSIPVGWFLAVAGALFVGLLLLAGFVFHEVGITTPLDGAYTWLHTTFGGMEEPAHIVGAWLWGVGKP